MSEFLETLRGLENDNGSTPIAVDIQLPLWEVLTKLCLENVSIRPKNTNSPKFSSF